MEPRQPGFTFIDLFAGIGGMRLGFEAAGGKCVFSSEIDVSAKRTYEANFREVPEGDIRKIPIERIPPHDILLAGFPCQSFSIAGVSKKKSLGRPHGFHDRTQGTLFFEIKRILAGRRPRAFLLENVKHLKSHDHGRTYRVIQEALTQELGYDIHTQILDAKTLVPQHRERIFIAGFDRATPFEFPKLEDRNPLLRQLLEREVEQKYTLSDHLWRYLQAYAQKHRAAGNGFGYGIADLNGVTRTLSARYYKDGSEILIPQRGRNPRRLTPRECARLMGFPDTFKIVVSDTQAYKQFGNSVVVPLVERIAKAMIEQLYGEGRTGQTQLEFLTI
jgi:DNA (cytosine-5)-methyltransferase 1